MANSAPDITDSTAFKLHRATVLIDRIADDYLQTHHGIRYAPFLVLLMVRLIGPTTQQSVAAALNVSRASVTQRVGALVEARLLSVETDPNDSRANRVSLSPEGGALLERAWQGLESHQNGLDDDVDEQALAAQLDRLIANAVSILDKTEKKK